MGGITGIICSLDGLLVPSSVITCLLTVGFLQVEHVPAVQAALKAIIPETAGIALVVGLRFAQLLFRVTSQEGIVRLSISTTIILVCALAIIVLQITVILVLPCAALTGMMLFTSWRERNLSGSQLESLADRDSSIRVGPESAGEHPPYRGIGWFNGLFHVSMKLEVNDHWGAKEKDLNVMFLESTQGGFADECRPS